ncbi:acyl transferase/acyl hydrolase/lysophospholipase [Diplogelasinospora grovesii]|uniref:Acyl transferase/acyl hydrolase/lysophospholipase n=1 Tax=Diplogelasinospora grovesii TaxID=303347 RepID=A0AAN6N6V4_9PEZI|nr:acyl transferase/acyl hydrolase/lysophospholipase [Diplogelasinospora grovesii]
MAAPDSSRGLRVLSLDGGGVRGLASLVILEYLMKAVADDPNNPPKPCEFFHMIGGTSTGGLIAIMLGRLHMTVQEAKEAYLGLSKTVFAPKHRLNKIASFFNATKLKGYCDTEALEREIKKIVQDRLKLANDQEKALMLEENPVCRSFVCALRGEKRSLICFRNYTLEGKADLKPEIWQAARATSAATLFFDPITIGEFEQTFVDGGGGYNNPVEVLYDEATGCWQNPARDFQCVVSIGTGRAELKNWGANLNQLRKTLVDIATETDKTAARFSKSHPELVAEPQRLFRFQVAHGLENVGMAEHEKIKEIASATQVYMEEDDQDGTKQLKMFRALVCGNEKPEPVPVLAPLNSEKMHYIEKHSAYLGFRSSPWHTKIGARHRHAHSAGTLSLPKRLFTNADSHISSYTPMPGLATTMTPDERAPTWWLVLQRYNDVEGDNDTCRPEDDPRRATIAVQDATWLSTDFCSGFAPEIPVTDIWRLCASFNPLERESTNEPNTDTAIHVSDLWISVPASHRTVPVVQMSIRPNTVFMGGDETPIPSQGLAQAMCGGGPGLPPDTLCEKRIYSSNAEAWDTVKMPQALAFATIPIKHRCLFPSQLQWAQDRIRSLLKVCHFLWDHADATDLAESEIPIKVLLVEMTGSVDYGGLIRQERQGLHWKTRGLMDEVVAHVSRPTFLQDELDFVEIEDAVTLLEKSGTYSDADEISWDRDGKNQVVDEWWGYLGETRARWVALLMVLMLLENVHHALILPEPFEQLIHSRTGTCFIAP